MFKFIRCKKEKGSDILIALSEVVAIHSHYKDEVNDSIETKKGKIYKVVSENGKIDSAIVKI